MKPCRICSAQTACVDVLGRSLDVVLQRRVGSKGLGVIYLELIAGKYYVSLPKENKEGKAAFLEMILGF